MKEVELRFGRRDLKFHISSSHVLATLRPNAIRPRMSPDILVQRKLRGVADVLQNEPTVIVVPDKTRTCAASVFLPILVGQLNDLGVCDGEISIIVANGSHAPNSSAEIQDIVGKDMAGRLAILQHNCYEPESLRFVGETAYGTPVLLNKVLLDTPQVIVGGTVVHHYFAGYGGGPKMINPGCAGFETITRNHALTIDADASGLHPGCRAGLLAGNPVQEDIRDSMRFVNVDLLLETVLNEHQEIVDVFAGELFETHDCACQLIDRIYKAPITEKADLVVASCGGFPKDINLIQAHKTVHNACQAVKDGGVVLVLAECAYGVGSETFLEWFDYGDETEQTAALLANYKLNGTTALSFRLKSKQACLIFVSTLPDEIVEKTGMLPAPDLNRAWQIARSQLPENFTCYLMPNGSLTLPVLN